MKSVYYYDNEGYFTVTEPAYLNVEETEKQGKDVYYCPESATLIEPPEIGENEILHFDGVKWNIVKNYKWQYEINENMELKAIDHYGEPDEGYYLITKEEYDKIIQDRDYYILENGKLVENPDYEEIKAKKERQRLNMLNLTKADVLLALYQDKGITPEDIKTMLKDNTPALIKFDYASSYYRGDEVVNALGLALGYTTEEMDYLFENKTFPAKVEEPADTDSDTDSDIDTDTDNDTEQAEDENANTTDTDANTVPDEMEQPSDTTEETDTDNPE